LEAILTALAQQGILSVPALVQLLVQDMCHYFMKLQQADQAERERRRKSRSSAGATTAAAARDGDPSTAIDVDVGMGQEAAGADKGPEDSGLARGEIVEGLRHVFALLSMLASAQPGAIKAKHVPVLLEVAFSPHLAVSDPVAVVRLTRLLLRHQRLLTMSCSSSKRTLSAYVSCAESRTLAS
jgi:hypothetical protein